MQGGALTFLFTDIEASTRRWETDAGGMSAALADHDETLRTAVAAAGGSVFKHTGDGMCAVFGSAAAALAGAIAAQRQLAAGPLRVRMAIHSGEVEARDDDYFGPTLNRAARLMAAAWGGQTLVSAAAVELAGHHLPAGTSLRDLGVHRLADLTQPERIFELCADELPADFPPIRTMSARRDNLPPALTSFVGRERELAELSELLTKSRLVTVTGVGGAGKTRLGIEAAARALDQFSDGVFLAELAPVTDPELVPSTVATALGLLLDQPGPLSDQLARYLEKRTMLIVFDNCEHVIEAAAGLAETMLRAAAAVTVLSTSREPLGVPGETVWRIPPLEQGDAFELICDRARTADPSFSPSDTDALALQRICTRLDGIPLALELAAARLHLLSPADVAGRLDDRFRLLTGGARTAVDRHRTLRATIDWGYDLLDEPSRSLLRRLSIFVGGFDLPAAEAVGSAGTDTAVLDILGGLVDRSWVSVERSGGGPTRYRLIETIRQYAAEKLAEAGEAEDARWAHCRHFRRLAEGRGDDVPLGPGWLRQARVEEDNLRAALEWAVEQQDRDSSLELAMSLLGYLAFTARGKEGHSWLQRALAVEPRDHSRRRLVAMWLLAGAWPDIDPGSAVDELRSLLGPIEETGDADLAANVRATFAMQLARQDPLGRAADIFHRAGLGAIPADSEAVDSAWVAANRGRVSEAASDAVSAEGWFGRAVELGRQGGQTLAVIHASAALAMVGATRGDRERVLALTQEAIDGARGLDLPIVLVMALTRAAEANVMLGRPGGATRQLTESLQILRRVGTIGWVAESLEVAAVLAAHHGDDFGAARLLGAAGAVDGLTNDVVRTQPPGADLAVVRARRALGDEGFAAGCNAGATLGTDQALGEAIAVLGTLGENSEAATSSPA